MLVAGYLEKDLALTHTYATMSPQDMARLVDRAALDKGIIQENEVFDSVCLELDGPEDDLGDKLRTAVRSLMQMRVADGKGFDLLCLKTLFPRMTHAEMTELMNALDKTAWSHRARACERLQGLVEKFPELENVLIFDQRGGARRRKVTGRQLAQEYEELKRMEKMKPKGERRNRQGEGGLMDELAHRHHVTGITGKPSWYAVFKRLQRYWYRDR